MPENVRVHIGECVTCRGQYHQALMDSRLAALAEMVNTPFPSEPAAVLAYTDQMHAHLAAAAEACRLLAGSLDETAELLRDSTVDGLAT
jgi:hypothetical protein